MSKYNSLWEYVQSNKTVRINGITLYYNALPICVILNLVYIIMF